MTTSSSTPIPDMSGRTVIITGANSGIGRAAAKAFAARRRPRRDRGSQPREGPRGGRGDAAARPRCAGSTSPDLASVHEFADGWQGDIDLLINNAGVMVPPLSRTADGFELQFGTNHLGHFALTNLLLDQVTGRVVTVSSTAHKLGQHRLRRPELGAQALLGLARLRAVQAREPALQLRAAAPAHRRRLARALQRRPPRLRGDQPAVSTAATRSTTCSAPWATAWSPRTRTGERCRRCTRRSPTSRATASPAQAGSWSSAGRPSWSAARPPRGTRTWPAGSGRPRSSSPA